MQHRYIVSSYQMGRVVERREFKAVDVKAAQEKAERVMVGKHGSDKGVPIRVLGIKAV